ncbi:MAG: hypothetical protein Greene041662_443 [Candidatus Peregrinibacteria bacterium Greene0416_62]|nr:MAG: hypothetical protein Greene041662_443 [Candidatus Peregrinibacteria bacterium Greene0416_62]
MSPDNSSAFDHDTYQDRSLDIGRIGEIDLQYPDNLKDVQAILNAIHVPGSGKPRLEINDWAQRRLIEVQTNMLRVAGRGSNRKVSIMNVRCGGKTPQEMEVLFTRLQALEKSLPSLAGVLLTINPVWESKVEPGRMTERAVELAYRDKWTSLPRVPILPIPVQGYSFTAALNGGLALTEGMARQAGIDTERVMIVPMSFDVEVPSAEAARFECALQNQSHVLTARMLPDGSLAFPGAPEELQQHFHNMLLNPGAVHGADADLDNDTSALMTAYKELSLGRNSFQAHCVKVVVARGGIHPLCDANPHHFTRLQEPGIAEWFAKTKTKQQIDGMEDREFWLYLLKYHAEKVRAAVLSVVNYRDHSMVSQQAYSAAKAIREITGIHIIAAGAADSVILDDGRTLEFIDGVVPEELLEFRMGAALAI